MRVAAFISGGFVPAALHGTNSSLLVHIADWYPTLCKLAGVDSSDSAPLPPLPADPTDPAKDLYRNGTSWPAVDGKDVWPALLADAAARSGTGGGDSGGTAAAAPVHDMLWLSRETMLSHGGRYKLLVAQPDPATMNAKTLNQGWKCGKQRCTGPTETWQKPTAAQCACGCAYKDRTHFVPCLFDVEADPSERNDLSEVMPELLHSMWAALNTTNLEYYGTDHSPPALLGKCDAACAAKVYGTKEGPICGVPGC